MVQENAGRPVINQQPQTLSVTRTRAAAKQDLPQSPIDFGLLLGTIERRLEHRYDQITERREQSTDELQEFQ